MEQQLITEFISRYFSREDVMRRLPLDISIQDFWPVLEAARRELAQPLPLYDQNGQPFWFVLNPAIKRQVDSISASSRREWHLSYSLLQDLQEDAVLDEAVYSSMIEGAFTTRQEAKKLLESGKPPANKSQQMVKNNYDALTHVLEHLDEAISAEFIIQLAGILTRSASDEPVTRFRQHQVVVAGRDEVIYTPPDSSQVPDMMAQLISFIQKSGLHPVLTASIAHFYLVYIHPFTDGNGRTARALSLMILLQAGFDVFRNFPISGLLAQERGKYYKAIRNVEQSSGDMTYFIDFYSDMLSRAVENTERHIRYHLLTEQKIKALESQDTLNERQMKGARWLLGSQKEHVTVEAWKQKYRTATETARQDLLLLCDAGVLRRRMAGRKAVFDVLRD